MERAALMKLGSFAAALVLVFAGAALAGSAIDPSVKEAAPEHSEGAEMDTAMAPHGSTEAPAEGHSEAEAVPGLAIAQDGYRLVPAKSRAGDRPNTPFSFQIVNAEDEPVTQFDTTHERKLHLIVVRRDLATFEHLHPRMSADGTWLAKIDTSTPGTYRVYADFSVDGESLTLGTDLLVPGMATAKMLPAPRDTANAGGGYQVRLSRDDADLSFVVTKGFDRKIDLRPYLGADGHLVALRQHDLAFLHTHPEGEPGGSGPIEFETTFPSPGRYRLFLQFDVKGIVRTAAFTVNVTESDLEAQDGGH